MKLGNKCTYGDIKTIIRFAWFPVKLEESQWIWLENYRAVLKYDNSVYGHGWELIENFGGSIYEVKSKRCIKD